MLFQLIYQASHKQGVGDQKGNTKPLQTHEEEKNLSQAVTSDKEKGKLFSFFGLKVKFWQANKKRKKCYSLVLACRAEKD